MKKDSPIFDSWNEVANCGECPLQGRDALCKRWHDTHSCHPGKYTYAEACEMADAEYGSSDKPLISVCSICEDPYFNRNAVTEPYGKRPKCQPPKTGTEEVDRERHRAMFGY